MEGLMILIMGLVFSITTIKTPKGIIIVVMLTTIPYIYALVAVESTMAWSLVTMFHVIATVGVVVRHSGDSPVAGVLYLLVVMTNATLGCLTLGIWTW